MEGTHRVSLRRRDQRVSAASVGGRGVGTQLYDALFPLLHARGIHAVIGGIALPNAASVARHEKFGMHKVAHFEQTGIKFGQWVDVGYWQRVRSA